MFKTCDNRTMKQTNKKKGKQTMSIKATSPFEELKWTIVDCREAVYKQYTVVCLYLYFIF